MLPSSSPLLRAFANLTLLRHGPCTRSSSLGNPQSWVWAEPWVGGVGDSKDSALRWQKLLQEENTAESRKFQEYWRWFRVAESLPSSWCDSRNWTLRSQMSQMHWSMLLDASGIPCRSYKSNWQQSFPTCLRILQRRSLKIIDYRL